MFKKKSYKKVVISILALTMIFGTVALAAEGIITKQITATYGRIKFNYEGSDVTSQIESKYDTPAFTVDGRAYAPVRAMADLLGVDIEFDDKTQTVKITDNVVEEYEKRLDAKDKEIEEFKEELRKLKEGVVDKGDLKSLEKDLKKKYDEYENVKFDVVLKEDKDDITININTDLSATRDEQYWIRMTYNKKKGLIEDIVREVRKEFKDVKVTGAIYDSRSKKDLYTFSQTKSGSLSVSNKDYVGDRGYPNNRPHGRRADEYVEDEFYYYGIYDARLKDLGYKGSNDYFEIFFPNDRENEKAWDDLIYYDYKDIEGLLDDISREIEYDYDLDGYIEIDIYMGNKRVGTYDRNGRFRE